MAEPRDHHYLFAHRLLPSLFFADPAGLMAALGRERAALLTRMWRLLGDKEIVANAERIAPLGLWCEMRDVAGISVALVSLPPPRAATEAYFVALAYRPAPRRLFGPRPLVRYLTLEYGLGLDGEPLTVLCEWHKGTHQNHGMGPGPTRDAFFEAVRGLLDTRAESR